MTTVIFSDLKKKRYTDKITDRPKQYAPIFSLMGHKNVMILIKVRFISNPKLCIMHKE